MGFTVAAIVNEPSAVIERFVAWYLAQGAEAIWLYFDDPASPDLTRFSGENRVKCTACTPEFWQTLGLDADARFTRRQNALLTAVYKLVESEWLLNVDADELMFAPGTTLAEWLVQKTDAKTLRIDTAEYVQSEGREKLFRLPVARSVVNDLYGPDADLFRRRFGLTGHADGKSFHRKGMENISLRQHWAEDSGGTEILGERLTGADGIYLLHMMALDYDRWHEKLEWRVNAQGFPRPIKEKIRGIQAQTDGVEVKLRALFDLLHGVTTEQIAALEAVGGLLRLSDEIPDL